MDALSIAKEYHVLDPWHSFLSLYDPTVVPDKVRAKDSRFMVPRLQFTSLGFIPEHFQRCDKRSD